MRLIIVSAVVLITLSILLSALLFIHPAPEPELSPVTGLVTRVIDGDTIVVENVGTIRLADIDCPEKGGAEGEAAAEYARNLLLKRYVEVETTKDQDKYGRTVAHIRLLSPTGKRGAHFNKMLVVSGHAVIRDYPDAFRPEEWCPELLDKYEVMPYIPGNRMYEIPEGYGKGEA